jgi:hypothetical protein
VVVRSAVTAVVSVMTFNSWLVLTLSKPWRLSPRWGFFIFNACLSNGLTHAKQAKTYHLISLGQTEAYQSISFDIFFLAAFAPVKASFEPEFKMEPLCITPKAFLRALSGFEPMQE